MTTRPTRPAPSTRLADVRTRAELVAAGWELLSGLLFASAVVPLAFSRTQPGLVFLASLAVSWALARPLLAWRPLGIFATGALRAIAWPLSVLPVASQAGANVFVVATTFGVLAGAVRVAVYRRVGTTGLGGWRRFDDLRSRLGESATLVGIVGGHVLLLFTVAFLRTRSQVLLEAWFELVPWLAALGTLGFTLAMRPVSRPLDAAARVLEAPRGRRSARDAARVLEAVEAVPARLALLNFALWQVCTTAGVFYVRPGPIRWELGDAVLQVAACGIFSAAVSFYQRALHRDTLAPVVASLRRRAAKAGEGPRPRRDGALVGLRVRLLRDFGTPMLFLAAISLLSTVALQRALGPSGPAADELRAFALLFAAFGVIVAAAFGVVARASRELAAPMADLARAADRVARGDLRAPVPTVGAAREVRGLGESVERMREHLASTIAELERERAGLEVRVDERTRELSSALEELKRAQAALVQSERMAALGELVAGVAHEIYNPLNAIAGAAAPLDELAADVREAVTAHREAARRLPDAQRAELAARVAPHEAAVDAAVDDIEGIAHVIRRGVDRSVRIVQNLRDFSRASGERAEADLHAGLDETLVLLRPRLRDAGIEIERRYGELPHVRCSGAEINQIFMNLFTNAIHAIEAARAGRGEVEGEPASILVETHEFANEVRVAITDDGDGVAREHAARIFDPFFTTKPRGQGTGLGLSISAEIARKHGGALWLETTPRLAHEGPAPRGARFVLSLPTGARPSSPA